MDKFTHKLMKIALNIINCHLLYHVEFINKHNEEDLDKCIICPNHSNTLEPTWIYAKTPNLNIMAKAELFEKKILNILYTYFGVFPIRRGQKDIKSIIHAVNLLKKSDNKKLLIFPEGERMPKGIERGEAKIGPAYIAYKADVPIVPVYITKNVRLFSKVKIVYGKPIYVTEEVAKDKEKMNEFSKELLDIIYDLNPDKK